MGTPETSATDLGQSDAKKRFFREMQWMIETQKKTSPTWKESCCVCSSTVRERSSRLFGDELLGFAACGEEHLDLIFESFICSLWFMKICIMEEFSHSTVTISEVCFRIFSLAPSLFLMTIVPTSQIKVIYFLKNKWTKTSAG